MSCLESAFLASCTTLLLSMGHDLTIPASIGMQEIQSFTPPQPDVLNQAVFSAMC